MQLYTFVVIINLATFTQRWCYLATPVKGEDPLHSYHNSAWFLHSSHLILTVIRVLEFSSGISSSTVDNVLVKQSVIKIVEAVWCVALLYVLHQLHLNRVWNVKCISLSQIFTEVTINFTWSFLATWNTNMKTPYGTVQCMLKTS